ncbi:MAG: peptidase S41 [Cyanobacteria bacterium M_surface_7_m2_040]|nr:peptidase S41 [Cyanobacteria bacterium M_surface_9_m1_291]MBM5826721.1 peptidase S41 [Cyanobacteria bacterium M_surface_7_m2_040]
MNRLRESTHRNVHAVSPGPFETRRRQPPQGVVPALLQSLLQALLSPVLALVLACSALAGPWLLSSSPVLALSDAQQLVVEAWRLVNQSYVDPAQFEQVQWKRLRQKALEQAIQSSEDAYRAIDAMLAPLADPYTRLLRPSEYSDLQSNTQGSVMGVGLQLGLRSPDQQVVVIAPLDGSPAAEAGISSGMVVQAVDGQATAELGLEGTASRLRGPSGSEVLVQLVSPDGRRVEHSLQRRQVDLQPVRSKRLRSGEHTLGYLRITQFAEPVSEQVHQALEDLSGKGIEGLILDLRNNSGGLVSAGLAVADQLLSGDPIVTTAGRDGLSSPVQANPARVYDGPLLTLVNGGTASASEILAGALQDDGRSLLAGSQTFGKGLIQSLIPLGDGSGLAVTVARYLTPSGRDIQHQGITPDEALSGSEPLNPGADDDGWLAQAQRLLVQQLEIELGTA